jgi:hypothetical protein
LINIEARLTEGAISLNSSTHYSKKRDQRELASAAMEKWEQSGKPKNVAGK